MKKICFATPVVFLFFVVIFLSGCDNPRKIPKDFDYGTWTGSTYKNDFFGFSITVPENWHIANKEEVKTLMQEGQDADFINKNEMEKINKAAEISQAYLFYVSRYTDEEAMEKEVANPFFTLAAENISLPEKKIDLAQYVKLTRQNLAKIAPGARVKSETNKTLDGKEFTLLQVEIKTQGITISQEMLICLEKNFALAFSLTTLDDEEKEQLDAIMATLKWE